MDRVDGEYVLKQDVTPEEEEGGCLRVVFTDGEEVNPHSLVEIRERLHPSK